ncbi:MAG TPA: cellulose synthase operon protein YhjQ/BcsQ [Terriglobales bacterium]|nr:cellulose synthase operon protein YhjQ/BcsQ [Terriglobales bacterium]
MTSEQHNDATGLCIATLCVDAETAAAVKQAVIRKNGNFAGEMEDYAHYDSDPLLLQKLEQAELPVCVIDFDAHRLAATAAAGALQQRLHGRGNLIAVSSHADPALILETMRAGCGEYLTKPVSAEQVAEALDRLHTRMSTAKAARAKPSGRVLALLGSRGGAGTTTLAVHLGCFLVRQYGKRTLILDEHRRLGHVSLYLGENENSYHFYELVRNVARLDEILLDGFVIHHSQLLDILPSPDIFDDSANVSLDDIQRAIRFLGHNYEFVVIDCPHGVHNLSLATIDCCDELYLIATPDVPALRDLSRHIDRLLQSNVPPTKIKVVVNRFSSEGALTLEQIEKAIRQPIAITIPNASSDLIRAMNTGNPVGPDRKSEFAIQMKKWAATLVPDQAPPEPAEPKRRFAFWN